MKSMWFVILLVAGIAGVGAFAFAIAQPGSATPTTAHPTMKNTETPSGSYSKSGFDVTRLSAARIEELAKTLTPEETVVILRKGTEAPFCGNLLDNKKEGFYACRLCGLPLFASDSKFDSGTGWPSFFRPFDPAHIREIKDTSHGMVRTEILCARCDGHLGHVFDDGPKPTGQRYCLNSVSLKFYEKGEKTPPESTPIATETAYFAGGCFWGVEDRFQQLPGVIDAVSGYMGGKTSRPTYKQVCNEDTGHAETVKVVFDPARITYRQLLDKFYRFHDGTQVNRQGPDIGTQYRSAIFTTSPLQAEQARAFIAELSQAPKYSLRKIVTQVQGVEAAGQFWPAEDYHQDYHLKNGGHCPLPPE